MRAVNLDQGWKFKRGMFNMFSELAGNDGSVVVNLPHDYMIESDVVENAAAGLASGYYTEGVAYYTKMINIPCEWSADKVFLQFDGVMMNATIDINGGKVALMHNGYIPFQVDITPYIYFGVENRVTITVNPGTQPNSRWYTGAGIIRSVQLVHTPKLHIAYHGIFGYTKNIEYDEGGNAQTAFLQTEVKVQNDTLDNKIALVEVFLTKEGACGEKQEEGRDEVIISRARRIQINPNTTETAEISVTLDDPKLWNINTPNLYKLHARVTEVGNFITHLVKTPEEDCMTDEAEVLFGVRTVTADVKHGLRINGKTVKLKGGCLHHDNGVIGAVSLYDSEARKISILKQIGFNAIRTTHNPPSSALLEACDRLGMFVFDEAFDAWGIMKQPGDYNLFFETDWKRDMTLFMTRDRNHPSVIIWSIGNEITERGGLNNGYTLAKQLADHAHSLDCSRPVSNGICSYWTGLDDQLILEDMKAVQAQRNSESAGGQNTDTGKGNTTWEERSECFTNGLDIVGYNYMEDKYPVDHEMYPERVILGSENFPKEIGKHWPMIESTPYVIGDFTWTAWDYIGEAGLGKSVFLNGDDLPLDRRASAEYFASPFPWRLANDADVDITGNILPQGWYRSVVWGSEKTHLFSYDPATYDLVEQLSMWGFTGAKKSWSWSDADGKPVKLVVFSSAEEVEVLINGKSIGRKKAGESLAIEDLPLSFVFDAVYEPGEVLAISYKNGLEVSRDTMKTAGAPTQLCLIPETENMVADGHHISYVQVEVRDAAGDLVPDTEMKLKATVEGAGELLGFGSANPVTLENYHAGEFTTYGGRALAVVRSNYEAGEIKLTVKAADCGFGAELVIKSEEI